MQPIYKTVIDNQATAQAIASQYPRSVLMLGNRKLFQGTIAELNSLGWRVSALQEGDKLRIALTN